MYPLSAHWVGASVQLLGPLTTLIVDDIPQAPRATGRILGAHGGLCFKCPSWSSVRHGVEYFLHGVSRRQRAGEFFVGVLFAERLSAGEEYDSTGGGL